MSRFSLPGVTNPLSAALGRLGKYAWRDADPEDPYSGMGLRDYLMQNLAGMNPITQAREIWDYKAGFGEVPPGDPVLAFPFGGKPNLRLVDNSFVDESTPPIQSIMHPYIKSDLPDPSEIAVARAEKLAMERQMARAAAMPRPNIYAQPGVMPKNPVPMPRNPSIGGQKTMNELRQLQIALAMERTGKTVAGRRRLAPHVEAQQPLRVSRGLRGGV